MTKNIIAAALSFAVLGLGACNKNQSFQTSKDGLQYKIIKGGGKADNKANMGDIVEAHIKVLVGDSVIFDSHSMAMSKGEPIKIPVQELKYKFQPEAGFTMLSPGDSGVFRVPIDSFKRRGEKMPPWMKGRDMLEYRIKLISIQTQQQAQEESMKKAAGQKATDDSLLQDYFKKNNLQPQKTASGLYYIIEKPGTGDNIKSGQDATVIYTGTLLDGKEFDSNDPKTHKDKQPFTVKVGQHQVIEGWDEGLQLLKKGSVAKLFIPSGLGYGANSGGPIPPNSVLVFDVEIKDVK
jgi:FKBP-type peptidyl-prolyl cis-trans isomerase